MKTSPYISSLAKVSPRRWYELLSTISIHLKYRNVVSVCWQTML